MIELWYLCARCLYVVTFLGFKTNIAQGNHLRLKKIKRMKLYNESLQLDFKTINRFHTRTDNLLFHIYIHQRSFSVGTRAAVSSV